MNVRTQFLGKLFVLCVSIACLYPGIAWGQATNSADVTGSVTDPSGAVVPGVAVTVTDLDKNTVRTLTTNEAGVYDTGPIVPTDRYQLEFKKEGFATVVRGPMTLSVGVTGMNVQLSLAQTAQQVVVHEAAPLLTTTTAEISATMTGNTLTVLPQVGTPDWQSFIVLLPGTRGTPQNGNNSSNPGMGGVSANGSMPFSNAYLDGASTSSPMSNNVINTPIFDAIAEVKVTDSLFPAQYGAGGVLYNQISKGGTNKFHGMGYDYFQTNGLNASDFQFGVNKKATFLRYHALGGQVGGPIVKNRVFFFGAYQNVINHGGNATQFQTVPTAAMLAGDFTGMNTIYDPTTQTVDPATGIVTRQSFADEYGNGNKIPAAMIDPVAKAIQAIYPAANLAGTISKGVATNNFTWTGGSPPKLVKYFTRIDADLTQAHRLTGTFAYNPTTLHGVSPVCPVNCLTGSVMNINSQISDYWTIGPTTTNEARIGYMGEYDLLSGDTIGGGWPAKIGMQFAKADAFPQINITGWYALGPNVHANYKEDHFDMSDILTMIRGRHVLHFGGELVAFRADSTAWGNINAATLGFTGVYTAGSNSGPLATTTGVSYADFLLGYANSWNASVSPQYGGRLKSPSIFFQDDFKMTPNLTLNLGLRWTGTTGWSEVHGNERSFDPTITNPATGQPGAMWFAVNSTTGRSTLQKSQMNNWLPRLGFAYQLGANTTIRGGFGVSTFPWNVDTYASNGLGNAFTSSGNENDSTGNVYPVVILSADGNTNYQLDPKGGAPLGSSINSRYKFAPLEPEGYNGQGVGFVQYDSPIPTLKMWNLTVQRHLGGNMMFEIGYVGSRGTNMPFYTDLNQVPEDKLGPGDAIYRPYPFQSITGVSTAGASNYNALQGMISRRMSNGLEFNFNYTWSHMQSTQDSSGWGTKQGNTPYQSAYFPLRNYGNSNFDVRQMFKGQAVYELPFGLGRTYANSNATADKVVGGWTLAGTLVAQTGNPFTPYMGTNNSYALSSNMQQFPDVVGNPVLSNPDINGWFNVSALTAPAAGTFGNMGRNSLFGPGLSQVGLSLLKTFVIHEEIRFDFSVNSTNILNHPSFALPDLLVGPGHVGAIRGVTVSGRHIEFIGKLKF
jgi:hypothetical protein